jgi:hypothetical protein
MRRCNHDDHRKRCLPTESFGGHLPPDKDMRGDWQICREPAKMFHGKQASALHLRDSTFTIGAFF